MQELVDYISAGNRGLSQLDWLILEFNSNSIYPYGIRNYGEDTGGFYRDIEKCRKGAKKYFASLDKPVEPEQPTEALKCDYCQDLTEMLAEQKKNTEHFQSIYENEFELSRKLRGEKKSVQSQCEWMKKERDSYKERSERQSEQYHEQYHNSIRLVKEISELKRKLELSEERDNSAEFLEYNHQLLTDKKRLSERINESEKLCAEFKEKIAFYEEHYSMVKEEKEELRTFIFDTLKLETLFHKLKKNV